ncbi:hypothetical protein Nepgr_031380 [Nepenthes gracilis]|uniref:Uncharacterized protein n=1 Tax=Nepenthes gracilis TaxID=150966 RepID=A0AAD3TIQ3_NEPGR|nr:hypothetical protein Nepgr_031380 [Nepenthes gracilis]
MSGVDMDTTCSSMHDSTEPSEYVQAVDLKSKHLSSGRRTDVADPEEQMIKKISLQQCLIPVQCEIWNQSGTPSPTGMSKIALNCLDHQKQMRLKWMVALDAKLDDNASDLLLVHRSEWLRQLRFFMQLQFSQHLSLPYVEYVNSSHPLYIVAI